MVKLPVIKGREIVEFMEAIELVELIARGEDSRTQLKKAQDEVPVDGTTSGDIDLEHFCAFFEKLYGERLDETGISLGQLLNNLGMVRDTRLNLAGLKLFGKTLKGINRLSSSMRRPSSAAIPPA